MSDFKDIHVLIVDDNRHLRWMVREILSPLEALVSESGDAEEALERFRTVAADVVLVDYELPGMNGAQLIRGLRNCELQSGRPPAAILLMTAHGDLRRVKAAVEAGADGVVAKPISTGLLLDRISAARARALKAAVDDPRQFRRRGRR